MYDSCKVLIPYMKLNKMCARGTLINIQDGSIYRRTRDEVSSKLSSEFSSKVSSEFIGVIRGHSWRYSEVCSLLARSQFKV